MVKPIHQHLEYGNQDDPKLNESMIVAISSILMNPQLRALSVEREDIIKEHAPMLWYDPTPSYCTCFSHSSLFSFCSQLWWIGNCTSV